MAHLTGLDRGVRFAPQKVDAVAPAPHPLSPMSQSPFDEAAPQTTEATSDYSEGTHYTSAHTRASWVDPLGITITRLTADLSWPLYGAAGKLGAGAGGYEFPYDNWKNSGLDGPYLNSVNGGALGWRG